MKKINEDLKKLDVEIKVPAYFRRSVIEKIEQEKKKNVFSKYIIPTLSTAAVLIIVTILTIQGGNKLKLGNLAEIYDGTLDKNISEESIMDSDDSKEKSVPSYGYTGTDANESINSNKYYPLVNTTENKIGDFLSDSSDLHVSRDDGGNNNDVQEAENRNFLEGNNKIEKIELYNELKDLLDLNEISCEIVEGLYIKADSTMQDIQDILYYYKDIVDIKEEDGYVKITVEWAD